MTLRIIPGNPVVSLAPQITIIKATGVFPVPANAKALWVRIGGGGGGGGGRRRVATGCFGGGAGGMLEDLSSGERRAAIEVSGWEVGGRRGSLAPGCAGVALSCRPH